jgi:hypothetical protein
LFIGINSISAGLCQSELELVGALLFFAVDGLFQRNRQACGFEVVGDIKDLLVVVNTDCTIDLDVIAIGEVEVCPLCRFLVACGYCGLIEAIDTFFIQVLNSTYPSVPVVASLTLVSVPAVPSLFNVTS